MRKKEKGETIRLIPLRGENDDQKYWSGRDGGVEDARQFGSRFLECEALRDEPNLRGARPCGSINRDEPVRQEGLAGLASGLYPTRVTRPKLQAVLVHVRAHS
ncbi:hypothetical protein V6N12_017091 [Hibiscus sabdariffa]|uniref:Uncharacterized protein n=1 Tax=Hibiscus sabdariffa TaxID=183260 RepID=A0ABR2ACZ8_9ROSI